MNDLFIDIMMNLTSELYQNGEKDINSMLLEQKQNRDFLLQAIASIILFKPVKNEFMDLSNKDYFESKKALDKLIKDNFTIEAKSEVKALDKIIEKTTKDKWGINDYVTNLGKDAGVKPIDKKVIDKIKNDKVAGKTAKSRIWNNKDEVYKHTQKRVDDFLKGKISVNDIEKEIKDLYNSNAYNTKRLVNDQIARAQAQANEEWFKENGVEYVLYDATLDGKTCSDCGGLDGKTYQKNKDRPPIPKHVGCRCCYIGLPDKDWRPDKRLDQSTSENIDYKTYNKWYNENKIKSFNDLKDSINSKVSKDLKKQLSDFEVDLKTVKRRDVEKVLEDSFKKAKFRISNEQFSYFDDKNKKIYLLSRDGSNTIAHELFHYFDDKNGVTKNSNIYSSLQDDFSKLARKSMGRGISIEEMIFKDYPHMFGEVNPITQKPRALEKYSWFSDIIDGISYKSVSIGSGHPAGYWNPNTIVMETWANYGAMYFEGNLQVLKDLEQLLPTTSKEINNILGGIK